MHLPDGFLDAPTAAGAGVVAVAGLGICIRRTADQLDDRQVPLAGLVAAFLFAAQMVNFPVAGGTSGHLIGGVLAAVLVGPYLGSLCLSIVLLVQALVFADGGITALGLNVVNMALVPNFGGYAAFWLICRILPRKPASVVAASGLAAALAVVLAALAFTAEYAMGGAGGASVATVGRAMVAVHVLIGIGEAVITAATVSTVLSSRPDLVRGARHLSLRPEPRPAGRGTVPAA